jgi:membrane carboxypeptidase/penicillin-binding protein PbpC
MYLANSKDFIEMIVRLNISEFYPHFGIDKDSILSKNQTSSTTPML